METANHMTIYTMRDLVEQAKREVRSEAKAAGKRAKYLDCRLVVGEQHHTHLIARGYIESDQRSFEVRILI